MGRAGSGIEAANAGWQFENIAEAFDDHVRKSVPLYDLGHDLVCQASDFFLPPDATVIELGTSTGALAKKFLDHHRARPDIRYIAYDRVESMLAHAKAQCGADTRIQFLNEDIVETAFPRSNLVLSYYTLQFVHPRSRQAVLNKIYESLEWGGAALVFEKVRGPDARFQDFAAQLYHEFKLVQGFDEEEILNKQRSLKGVLEPFSTQGNLDLFKRAGFVDVMTILKYVCFEGFLAIK
jgi:tRNA (cmo5U34)-methyltransferase